MRKSFLLLSLIISATYAVHATNATRLSFIDNYKDLAISEMHRTGIPASIKLAQAILESNAGQSTLAREANNHFGIKCGSYWKGKTFYRKDDDRNGRGKLIKSCFRAFKFASQSWVEHSDFLAVQNRRRYDFLFNYSSSDYTNWAYGLKKAGYATHPKYAPMLIQIIEEYQLYQYDNPTDRNSALLAKVETPDKEPIVRVTPKVKLKKKKKNQSIFDDGSAGEVSIDDFAEKVTVRKINGVPTYVANQNIRLHEISNKVDISSRKLLKYNEGLIPHTKQLKAGTKVFLAPKKSKFKGSTKFHYVRAGDSMASISKKYGVKLKSLYKMNRMRERTEPALGERIAIRRPIAKGRTINVRSTHTVRAQKVTSAPKPTITSTPIETTVAKENTREEVVLTEPQGDRATEILNQNTHPSATYHVVSKGETLWAIARLHNTSVDQLITMNDLKTNTLSIGQKLKIEK